MVEGEAEALWRRQCEANRRNCYTVAMSAQRTHVVPHDDGRLRMPLRKQGECGRWGWWLPHPCRRETWDFVPEDLPPDVSEYKYSDNVVYSYVPKPLWVQSPSGIWGWGVREEEFHPELFQNPTPWSMRYYLIDHKGCERLTEALISHTILIEESAAKGGWLGHTGPVRWDLLQPPTDVIPIVGVSPFRAHRKHAHPSQPRTGYWNRFYISDMKEGWVKQAYRAGVRRLPNDLVVHRTNQHLIADLTPSLEKRPHFILNDRATDHLRGLFDPERWGDEFWDEEED